MPRFSSPRRPDKVALLLLFLLSLFAARALVWEVPKGDYSSVHVILLSSAGWAWTIWAEISHRRRRRHHAIADDSSGLS